MMTDRFDRFLALWIGFAFPIATVPSPRIAQFFVGSSVVFVLAFVLFQLLLKRHALRAFVAEQVATVLRVFRNSAWRPAHVLLAFCVYALASASWSIDPAFSFSHAARFLLVAVLGIAFIGLVAPRLKQLDPRLILVGAALAAALCLIDWNTGWHILTWSGRPQSYGEYNRTAQHLAALVFFAAWCGSSSRIWIGLLALLVAGFVFATANDTAKLAFIVSAIVLVVALAVPTRAAVTASVWLFALSVPLIVLLQPNFLEIAQHLSLTSLVDHLNYQARLHIWDHIGRQFMESPLLGVGFDATRRGPEIGEMALFDGSTLAYGTPFHPHGQVLQIAYETGVVGLALFIAFGLALHKGMGRLEADRIPLALALFWGTYAGANVANSAFATWRLAFWAILMGLVIACALRGRRSA